MSLFSRLSQFSFSQLVETNLDELVLQSANPEEALARFIERIKENLTQLEQPSERVIEMCAPIHQQYILNSNEAQKWQERAIIARDKGEKFLAIEALKRMKVHQSAAREAKQILASRGVFFENSGEMMVALKNKIAEANQKKKEFANSEINKPSEPEEKIDFLEPEPLNRSKTLAIIEKSIGQTELAIARALDFQKQIQNRYIQAQTEAEQISLQALQALLEGDRNRAVQALMTETSKSQLADTLNPQIQQQEEVIQLLESNLKALQTVRNRVEGAEIDDENEDEEELILASGFEEEVDLELEELRKQLNNM